MDDHGPIDSTKQAYGHAFVILAAASVRMIGHPRARVLYDDAMSVLIERFWCESDAARGGLTEDWRALGDCCGRNANMHPVEAPKAGNRGRAADASSGGAPKTELPDFVAQ